MKTTILCIVAMIFGVFTGCTLTPEEKAEKNFKEWVKGNFDNPSDFKEVVSVTVDEGEVINTDSLVLAINRMNNLYNFSDSLFRVVFDNIELIKPTVSNYADRVYFTNKFLEYLDSEKLKEYDDIKAKTKEYADNKKEFPCIDRVIYTVKVRVKYGNTTKIETYKLYNDNITGDYLVFKNDIKYLDFPKAEKEISDLYVRGFYIYKENLATIVELHYLCTDIIKNK